jgi:SAM-dependent methyltransferase
MNPTTRFSDVVEAYIRYRPGYPPTLLAFLRDELNLRPENPAADIGAGPGKLTELLLDHGNLVYAVEPNGPMRAAAESLLNGYSNFRAINGRAEASGLPDACVDFVFAAQAFHWFDVEAFKTECRRILRPRGWIVLLWNDRVDEQSPFMAAYEEFLRAYSTDYRDIDLRRVSDPEFTAFFHPARYRFRFFDNYQDFDREGLLGRYQSSSYALKTDHPRYPEAVATLDALFERWAENGKVRMWYQTEVYYGRLLD